MMSNPLGADIAGILVAAAAPLTVRDIARLSAAPIPHVRSLVSGVPGRNLNVVTVRREPGYELGHPGLASRVVANLDPGIEYRAGLRDEAGWDALRDRAVADYRRIILEAVRSAVEEGWSRPIPYLLTEDFVSMAITDPMLKVAAVAAVLDEERSRAIQMDSGSTSEPDEQLQRDHADAAEGEWCESQSNTSDRSPCRSSPP